MHDDAPLRIALVGDRSTEVRAHERIPLVLDTIAHVEPGALADRALGVPTSVERYHCAYGPVRAHIEALEAAGMRFTAFDDDGHPRILELGDHPFFIGTLFQPELSSHACYAHPVVRALVDAAAEPVRRPLARR